MYIMKLKKYEQEKKLSRIVWIWMNPCVNVNKNLNFPTMHVNVNEESKVKVFYLIL